MAIDLASSCVTHSIGTEQLATKPVAHSQIIELN